MTNIRLTKSGAHRWEVPLGTRADMRVPARVFADEELVAQISHDRSLEQLVNVTTLPGVTFAVLGMPDMHEGYGFLVAYGSWCPTSSATNSSSTPNASYTRSAAACRPATVAAASSSFRAPSWTMSSSKVCRISCASTASDCPGTSSTSNHAAVCPEPALRRFPSAPRRAVRGSSARSAAATTFWRCKRWKRSTTNGRRQRSASLSIVSRCSSTPARAGSGTKYAPTTSASWTERWPATASTFPIASSPAHRSRHRKGSTISPRCAPQQTSVLETDRVIAHRVREAFKRMLGPTPLRFVYDLAHNTAKLERYDGGVLCVHRKGATCAFGPSHPETPQDYRSVGQPVLIPGSMGTASFVLVGTDACMDIALGSACHGAGRALSRTAAKRQVTGHVLRKELEARGIVVRCPLNAELAEEAPVAYKDVERVVDVVHRAGLARKVARLRPLGVVKG